MRHLWGAACLLLGLAPSGAGACVANLVELRDGRRQVAFVVEIADTDELQARGLMFRESLPRDQGMLFVFEDEAPRTFWMRNTLISLDMLFVDAQGVVCGLVERATPMTDTPRRSGCDALAVLEINGGLSQELGIGVGAEMRHPAFGSEAAWACPAP